MDPTKAERFHFKADHPRGVDRYIDYFGDGITIDTAPRSVPELTAKPLRAGSPPPE